MATLNAPVVPKFTLPSVVVEPPKPTAPAAVEVVEERSNEDDLLSALVAADDLLAGLADVGEMSVEAASGVQTEQRLVAPAADYVLDTGANAPVVTEAPAARKAPLLPPVRKVFAAPSSAKPAAPTEASVELPVDLVIQPRHKSAYLLFVEARRAELKDQKPDLKSTEVSKVLGAEWSALSPEAKAPFFAAAEAEKVVPPPVQPMKLAVKLAAPGTVCCGKPAASSSKKAPSTGDGAEQNLKPRTISAYSVFCSERRVALKAEQPDLEFGDMSKALSAEWKALDEAARLPYVETAAERTAAAPLRLAKAPKAKAPKRAALSSPDIDSEPESQDADIDVKKPAKKRAQDCGATTGVVEWGMDRSKPVSFLVSRLKSGSYVAFRQGGDGLTEEAAFATRSSSAMYSNCAMGDSAEMLLHTEEQELDFSMHFAQFKAAMAQRNVHGTIDLDDLEPDSPLLTMKTLHMLRFNGGPLDPATLKNKKNMFLGAALTAERARVAASVADQTAVRFNKATSEPAAYVAMEE